MKKLALLFVTLLMAIQLRAQEEPMNPPPGFVTRIPFRLVTGGIVLLKATLNDIPDSLNFILDTGSGGISLDSAKCSQFNIPLIPSGKTIRGLGGERKVDFAMNNQLNLPGLTVDSLNFHINNYDLLTSVYGIPIDGIVGYSVLSRYSLFINYDSLYIDFYRPGEFRYPKGGFFLRPIINNLPVVHARIEDRHDILTRYYFDTGAGLCLLLTEAFVKDSNIISPRRKPVHTQGEGLGGKIEMRLTVVRNFKVGPYKFRNIPTFIFDDTYNVTSYPSLGGLIGNDLLRRFNVYLNYARREFYLIPNNHFNDRFDYSYTGLGIYFINGKVVVTDVVKGSPAEKAGFRPGDIIYGVGNSLNADILTYKSLLQDTHSRIPVIVMRDGEVHALRIKPRSILKRK